MFPVILTDSPGRLCAVVLTEQKTQLRPPGVARGDRTRPGALSPRRA